MDTKLERHKLSTESLGCAYTNNIVVHTAYSPNLSGNVAVVKTKWKREKKVGAGGFGTIWLEREQRSGGVRAVKALSTRSFKLGFLREVEILADLRDVSLTEMVILTSLTPKFSVPSSLCAIYGLV